MRSSSRALLAFVACIAVTTPSIRADDQDVENIKLSAAFLSSPGSISSECKHMRRQMAVADRSEHMVHIALNCSDDVKRAGGSMDAYKFPLAIAIGSCSHIGWTGDTCGGMKMLMGH